MEIDDDDTQLLYFMKFRPVGAVSLHADGQQDRHEAALSHFSQVCAHTLKMAVSFNKHTAFVNTSHWQDADLVLLTLALNTVTTKL
jgi:hypothetical protein